VATECAAERPFRRVPESATESVSRAIGTRIFLESCFYCDSDPSSRRRWVPHIVLRIAHLQQMVKLRPSVFGHPPDGSFSLYEKVRSAQRPVIKTAQERHFQSKSEPLFRRGWAPLIVLKTAPLQHAVSFAFPCPPSPHMCRFYGIQIGGAPRGQTSKAPRTGGSRTILTFPEGAVLVDRKCR